MKLYQYLDMLGHRSHAKTGEHQHAGQALLDNDRVPTQNEICGKSASICTKVVVSNI